MNQVEKSLKNLAKTYAYLLDDNIEMKKAKGIKKMHTKM